MGALQSAEDDYALGMSFGGWVFSWNTGIYAKPGEYPAAQSLSCLLYGLKTGIFKM
jgi:hypothetical protein